MRVPCDLMNVLGGRAIGAGRKSIPAELICFCKVVVTLMC